MPRFVSMKQSCDRARVRVRAPAPARWRLSEHSRPHISIAVRSAAELREHGSRRAETLDHLRLTCRAVLARGAHLRQRPSRLAHRARLRQNRTRRAEALRSTVDLGCRDSNMNIEAPPPLWRLPLRSRNVLEVSRAQESEVLADSAIAAAVPVRDSRLRGPRRAQPQRDHLAPNRTPHRPPRQRGPCSHITELSTRQLRCARALKPSIHVRGLLDPSLLRGAYPFRARFGRA